MQFVVSLFSSGAAAGPSPGPGLRAQCEHHEGKKMFSAAHKKLKKSIKFDL